MLPMYQIELGASLNGEEQLKKVDALVHGNTTLAPLPKFLPPNAMQLELNVL
jgi:hypothetical protein